MRLRVTVSSHSLQPYRGCTFGRALCGAGCYVRHNGFLTRGLPWGSFLEARTNAAEAYRDQYEAERLWGRGKCGRFGVFMSSSTDPFVPQEDRFRVTRRVLYMATLGKAAGVAGAFVAGDETLIDWLIQRTRSYIFATAAPPLLATICS